MSIKEEHSGACPIGVRSLKALNLIEKYFKHSHNQNAPFESFAWGKLCDALPKDEFVQVTRKCFVLSEQTQTMNDLIENSSVVESHRVSDFRTFFCFGDSDFMNESETVPSIILSEDGISYVKVQTFYKAINELIPKHPAAFMKIFQDVLAKDVSKMTGKEFKKEDLFLGPEEAMAPRDPMFLLKLKGAKLEVEKTIMKIDEAGTGLFPEHLMDYEAAVKNLRRVFFTK